MNLKEIQILEPEKNIQILPSKGDEQKMIFPDIEKTNSNQFASYLRLNGMSVESAKKIEKAEISGADLKDLTIEDIESLGLPIGAKKHLLRIVNQVKGIK